MKKYLLLILSLFIIIFLNGCTPYEGGFDGEMEVVLYDGEIISGRGAMDYFYFATKKGEEMSIRIVQTYIDHNSLEQNTYTSVLEYNGHKYFIVGDNVLNYSKSYKYLNYSCVEGMNGNSKYKITESYCLADNRYTTAEDIYRSMFSSSSHFWIDGDIVFTHHNYLPLEFSHSSVLGVTYNGEQVKKDNSIFKIIDDFSWSKEKPNVEDFRPDLSVSAERFVTNDDNGLMMAEKINESLIYRIDLDNKLAVMQYAAISTDIYDLYAVLSDEQVNELIEFFE